MARARNIKPGFFTNEDLLDCEPLARLLFAGLWCLADREGRLEDRPKKIKIDVLPVDNCDADALLQQLHDKKLIQRYEIQGKGYIQILTFLKHQKPHVKEAASTFPEPGYKPTKEPEHQPRQVQAPTEAVASPASSLNPSSLNPSSLIACTADAREEVGDFQKVYEAGIETFPDLAAKNTSAIHSWLNAGCDVELDIIPEIRRNAGKSLSAWKYFTPGIMDAKATRESPPGTGIPRARPPDRAEEARAHNEKLLAELRENYA